MVHEGQILYRQVKGGAISEVKVERVGSKYFYIEGRKFPFDKKTLKYTNKEYLQHNIQLYLSKQVIMSEVSRRNNYFMIKGFDNWNNVSDEDLQYIADVILKYKK